MAINKVRYPKGKMEGNWHIEKVHYTGDRGHYDCVYYHKEKGICMNTKSHKYFSPCNFACRRWSDTPKRKGGTKSSYPKSNLTQECKPHPTKQDHTLCKYYEKDTGKCNNTDVKFYFPKCEGACLKWKKKNGLQTGNISSNTATKRGNVIYPSGSLKNCIYRTRKKFICKSKEAQNYFGTQNHICLYKCKFYIPRK